MGDPEEITIIVHGAKGLQGKKTGRHKYSVIFGVGSRKFRTGVVKETSGNPEWNEESVVQIFDAHDNVFFQVTEKDDILGQITMAVKDLGKIRGKVLKMKLQTHKKCPSPRGELVFQCYVSKFGKAREPVIKSSTPVNNRQQLTGFARIRQSLTTTGTSSPILPRRYNKKEQKSTSTLSSLNKRFSRSIHDLFSFMKSSNNEESVESSNQSVSQNQNQSQNKTRRFSLRFLSINDGLNDTGHEPIIESVSPSEALPSEETQITIKGENLGLGKSDIVELTICGCEVTDTIEYKSSERITCMTKSWSLGCGDIVMETVSGGIGVLKNGFTFTDSPTIQFDTSFDLEMSSVNSDFVDSSSVFETNNNSTENSTSASKSRTLPRMKSTENLSTEGRYIKKKHNRNLSESAAVAHRVTPPVTKEKEKEKDKDTEEKKKDEEKVTDADLLEKFRIEVIRLRKENEELKQDNKQMKGYIDRLVTKVLIHCPEALESAQQEPDK